MTQGTEKENIPSVPVSVIVPVYKAQAYLKACVDSILSQSFRAFELLLIDDGSPDESGRICEEYAAKDERVHSIHQPNGGVSSARNRGMEEAVGRYLVFIDSDDYVGPNYLRDLMEAAGRENTLVISDYQPFGEAGEENREFLPASMVDLAEGKSTAEDFRNLVFGFRVFPPYCKLYERRIIEENVLRFNTEIRTAEDFDFNIRYLKHVERIQYISSVQYFYRVGYKTYIPSNGGILGQSEIKSVHIMANGIVGLAKRMGVYGELEPEICLWAANKHYFNRLPMLYRENPEIGFRQRYRLYRQLIADETYRSHLKKGVQWLEASTTQKIGRWCDGFLLWWLFYWLVNKRRG